MTGIFKHTAARLVLLRGWRRFLVALLLGALAALALPPLGLWPVLFVSFASLVWLMDGAAGEDDPFRRRMAAGFAIGYAFGLGWFAASLFWIGEAFFVDAPRYAWLMPVAVLALPAGMALYWGLAGGLAATLWRPDFTRIPVLAAALTLTEALRGLLFGGFPWNLPAYAFDNLPTMAQSASIVGVHGLTFLIVLWTAAPALLADEPLHHGQRLSRLAGGLVIAVTALMALAFGTWRLDGAAGWKSSGFVVRLVQPNVPQKEKWKPANRGPIFRQLLAQSRNLEDNAPNAAKGSGAKYPDVIIWPESAVPFLLEESPAALKAIAAMLRPGQVLLTGAIRRAGQNGENRRKLYNSLMAIDDKGRIIAIYNKRKLVPFGEFLPLAGLLEPLGIRKLVALPGGFLSGNSDSPLRIANLAPFKAFVCYEIIFPQLVRRGGRAEWLVNITNDAWFGRSAGPYQHLAAARMRAIELGLPLARVANTGISTLFDPWGREPDRLQLGKKGILTITLPAALPPTIQARFGQGPVFLFLGLLLVQVAVHHLRERRRTS